ncbi:MAG: hypothetical protein M3R69_00965 [Acidobacteriota bacterium]|nr:hypothetical protein [Acidobacteriota bacterium]
MITQDTVDQLNIESREREAVNKAALEEDLKRINAEFAPFREEKERQKREANEAQEAEQRKTEERTDEELEFETRQLFFNGSPGASEELYQQVRDKFRTEVLLSRAQRARERATQTKHSIYRF